MSTISAALRAAAEQDPTLPAVIDQGATWTFAELDAEVDRIASALLGTGLGPRERVALWAPNSPRWIVASFAVYRIGAVLVPISTRYRGTEAADILRRSGATALLAANDFLRPSPAEMLDGEAGLERCALRIAISGDAPGTWRSWEQLLDGTCPTDAALVRERESAINDADISDLIFTSGTTGRPKGAMLRHGASVRTYEEWGRRVGLRRRDRYLVVYPFFHTAGLKSGILACVLHRATIHPQAVFDVSAMMSRVVDEQITMLPGPPTVFQTILDHPDRASFDLSSVRSSVTGAAVVPVEVIRRMRDELGIPEISTGYGLTETTGTVSVCCCDDEAEIVATTVGHPLPWLDVRVVDDDGAEVDHGVCGEFVVRGDNVMAGYFDDPQATAEAFTADGYLKTGDIGLLDEDGRLHITDRKKEMFIVGGFNAYPAEIESRLVEHPDVLAAAVIGVPDRRLGEVGLAIVQLRPGASLEPTTIDAALGAWARERMANFKVPGHFIVTDALPLNATGKVAKADLRSRYLDAGDATS